MPDSHTMGRFVSAQLYSTIGQGYALVRSESPTIRTPSPGVFPSIPRTTETGPAPPRSRSARRTEPAALWTVLLLRPANSSRRSGRTTGFHMRPRSFSRMSTSRAWSPGARMASDIDAASQSVLGCLTPLDRERQHRHQRSGRSDQRRREGALRRAQAGELTTNSFIFRIDSPALPAWPIHGIPPRQTRPR